MESKAAMLRRSDRGLRRPGESGQAPVDRHFPACQDLTYTHFARCGAVERRVDKTTTLLRRKSDSSLAE
ncbi:MAG: hypothetical protein VB141_03000 [Burkholderia gladioli]